MPTTIVRQPDGKLAAFSSIPDEFTAYDMSEQEAVEYLVGDDHGRRTALEKVQRGVEDHEPWKVGVKGDGLSRWRHALQQIGRQHGRDRLVEDMRVMGFADFDLSAAGITYRDDIDAEDDIDAQDDVHGGAAIRG